MDIPGLKETEGQESPLAVVKLFHPLSGWTWYVVEADEKGEFYPTPLEVAEAIANLVAEPVDHLDLLRPAGQVPCHNDAIDVVTVDVPKDGFQRRQIPVHVRQEGQLHCSLSGLFVQRSLDVSFPHLDLDSTNGS
jgi:hypothetical protein